MTLQYLLQHDFPLDDHNSFGIAAIAHHYVRIEHAAQLSGLPELMKHYSPVLILGGGSNIVLTGDVSGLVIHIATQGREIIAHGRDSALICVEAGENWHAFVQWTLAQGLPGLENLSLIPGYVGAAPIQNIGAYGAEVKDFIDHVTVLDIESGVTRNLSNADCVFGYRDSIFKRPACRNWLITSVTFALPSNWSANARYADVQHELNAQYITEPTAQQVSDAIIAIRQRKLPNPAQIGNAGSFFKNPVIPAAQRTALLEQFPQLISYAQPDGNYKIAAGWLIEQAGWKGQQLGQAGVYEKQALVLVNRGGATGAEIVALAQAIINDVHKKFGITLSPEPVSV